MLVLAWKGVSYGRKIISMIVVVISCGLVVFPWIYAFYNYTGQIGFTTASILSFPGGIEPFIHIKAAEVLYNQKETWTSLFDIILSYFDVLIKNPLSTIYLLIVKSIKCWYGTDSGRFETIMIFTNIPFLVLFLIGIFKILRRLMQKTKDESSIKTLPIILIIIGYILSLWIPAAILSLPIFRYMTPIFPLVVLIVFYSLFNPETNKKSKPDFKT